MKSNNIEQKGNIIRNINWVKDVHKARFSKTILRAI